MRELRRDGKSGSDCLTASGSGLRISVPWLKESPQ